VQKFNRLIQSEQKMVPETSATSAKNLVLPPLPKPTKAATVAVRSKTDDSDESKGLMGKLFKSAPKDEQTVKAKEEAKKRNKSFDELIKSDKTQKMTLKDGSATKKETSNDKFETYLKVTSPLLFFSFFSFFSWWFLCCCPHFLVFLHS